MPIRMEDEAGSQCARPDEVEDDGEGKERCQHCVLETDADRNREVDDGDIVESGVLVNNTNVHIGILIRTARPAQYSYR